MPDIQEDIKVAKNKLASINDQAAFASHAKIKLENELKILKSEIISFEKTRDKIKSEIAESEKHIAEKNSEREDSLNKREEEIIKKEEDVEKLRLDHIKNIKKSEELIIDMQNRIKNLATQKEESDSLNVSLKNEISKYEISKNSYEKLLSQQRDFIDIRTSQSVELEDSINLYLMRTRELEELIKINKQSSEQNRKVSEDLENRIKALNKRMEETNIIGNKTEDLRQEVQAKINDGLAMKYQYEKSIEELKNEEKKIQYAWLKIKKCIDDNKLDLELSQLMGVTT
jgi:chromosome segregation ATPase